MTIYKSLKIFGQGAKILTRISGNGERSGTWQYNGGFLKWFMEGMPESGEAATAIYFERLRDLQKWFDRGFLDARDLANVPRERLSRYCKIEESKEVEIPNLGARRPKIIVCHDFKGGYQSGHDLYPNGQYDVETSIPYWLRYPEAVDKFIYFSHHCISIPAVSWTNYLHRHSIPVLGTVILEHSFHDGELFKKNGSGDFIYVNFLVGLCRIFNFEGWLINFETGFTYHSDLVIPFLRDLTAGMESKIHEGSVMWYDAYVTSANKPSYQNEVNMLNWDAYSNSSQFMVNYMWNLDHLGRSLKNVGALGMHSKVGLGVDVWGRSMQVCKGGFESNIALFYAKSFGTNAVLFGPAWTYEYFGEKDFIENDDIFWDKIKTALNLGRYDDGKVSSWYISESNNTRYFTTFFCTGSGSFFNFNGERVLNSNWVQLSLTSPLPTHRRHFYLECGDAYVGGSCLAVPLSSMGSGTIHLFRFEQFIGFRETATKSVMKVKLAFKILHSFPPVSMVVKCFVIRREEKSKKILKVKDVSIALPLEFNAFQSMKWTQAEHTIPLPTLEARFSEECYVEGAQLEWTAGANSERVAIPGITGQLDAKLLLGSFCIQVGEAGDAHKSPIAIERFPLPRQESEEDIFMWIVLQRGQLKSVRFAPAIEGADKDIEVYEYSRSGVVKKIV